MVLITMTTVGGAFASLTAEGHCDFLKKSSGLVFFAISALSVAVGYFFPKKRYYDIACSAVSMLLKTVTVVLKEKLGASVEVDAKRRGFLSIKVVDMQPCFDELLSFVADFVRAGIACVAVEYHDTVRLVEEAK